jgi:membrane protein
MPFFIKRTIETTKEFLRHEILMRSSAIAFYAIFSLPAILILLLFLLEKYLGADQAQNLIIANLANLLTKETASIVADFISTSLKSVGETGSFFGILILIYTSSSIFVSVRETLDLIFEIEQETGSQIFQFLFKKILSFVFLIIIAVLFISGIFLETLIFTIKDFLLLKLNFDLGRIEIFTLITQSIVSIIFFIVSFKFIPAGKISFKKATIAGLITGALFLPGKFILKYAIGDFSTYSLNQAAQSLIIMIIWLYYSLIIFFAGAQITHKIIPQKKCK